MLNKVLLIGHVGKDPEATTTETGKRFVRLSLATSTKYKDKITQEYKEATEWHNLIAWDQVAEIIEKYAKKGSKIYIEGQIKTRNYEALDGSKKSITEILVKQITLLGSKGIVETVTAVENDNLPF